MTDEPTPISRVETALGFAVRSLEAVCPQVVFLIVAIPMDTNTACSMSNFPPEKNILLLEELLGQMKKDNNA